MHRKIGLTKNDILMAVTTISFDIAALEIYLPLIVGARVVLMNHAAASDGLQLSEILYKCGATVMQATPATWRLLLTSNWKTNRERFKILCGGEALSQELSNYLTKNAGKVWNLFGPTETTVWSSAHEVEVKWFTDEDSKISVPIGRPISNTQIYLLDRYLKPVPVAVPGELYIGGEGLARGYLNRPEMTAEKFLPDPFSNERGSRLYRTGDLARYLPDGRIEFLGRIDHQVKVRGFRIELGEIEAVLRQHPGVHEAVVVAREDNPGSKRLVAYVVPGEGSDFQISGLRSFLKEKLPDYMVPALFVLLKSLPLTPNGKIDRKSLPVPDDARPELEQAYVAPRGWVEERLAGIWCQVLGIDRIGIRDNFFSIGGHSLLATQIISKVREVFNVELPLRSIFEGPTVADLAERVEAAQSMGQALTVPPLNPVSRDRVLPLSFSQQRLWFLDQLEPQSSVYNLPAAVRFNGWLNIPALERSFQEIIRRHEALRTRFESIEGSPVQIIVPEQHFALPIIDLGNLAESKREEGAIRLAAEEARRVFDLAKGPLVRATLLRLGETDHVLLATMHHIVSDGWSLAILIRELTTLYEAFAHGRSPQLSPLPVQYADFAVWQREWLQGEALDRQLSYWKKQLGGSPEAVRSDLSRSDAVFHALE
jgi:acyl carrier protein